ncbi:hypothetical protein [uncultured Roseovarius sp.]|uniref:hypothetical protein n=1 Tax=uncultured Roseovarius sp. TaxID=293344 RepID=UPI002606387E|nr:hypothetical protein [uncultured Roseovarius sp.]
MRRFVAILVVSSIVLSGCSRLRDSRINPGNWFGGGSSQPAVTNGSEANPLIPKQTRIRRKDKRKIYRGTPVDQVTSVQVEPTTSGAIIRVSGVSLQQGAHDVRLTSENDGEPIGGVLTLRLRALQPTNTPQGQARQRTLHAGRFVSNNDLALTNTIRVIGARNEITARP